MMMMMSVTTYKKLILKEVMYRYVESLDNDTAVAQLRWRFLAQLRVLRKSRQLSDWFPIKRKK